MAAPDDDTAIPRERADSRRKRLRLVEAARQAVAEKGLDVAAADIAARAEVGVGTLYRRFGSREALVQDVLADGLAEVQAVAEQALTAESRWEAVRTIFLMLSDTMAANRGVAQFTAMHAGGHGEEVERKTVALREAIDRIVRRAQEAGEIRDDVTWQDLVLLATPPADANECLGVGVEPDRWRHVAEVALDGMRPQRAARV